MSSPNDYVVGWICAISTELVAARAFLDEEHDLPNVSPPDNNIYTLGKMGKHNIVIAALPDGEYGISAAASVARDMLHSFPNVRIGLMVGIGGGVPGKHDIRLGDVVVSATHNEHGGVFQYDFGKTVQAQEFQNTKFLNQPPALLRSAVGGLKADYESNGHQFQKTINSILIKKSRLRKKYRRPDSNPDRLYLSNAVHPLTNNESCSKACSDSMMVPRQQRAEGEDDPMIHYGLIASGNQLMKDALIRDQLASEKDVLCFEMEAAGLMNHFPCLVIRGICDYSDSHKNDIWQGYAAMTAAAYAKDVIGRIPPTKIEAENRIADILSGVKQSVDRLVNVYHDQRNIAILDWLTPPDYSAQQSDHLRRRQEGTGEWLLNSDEFQAWVQNKDHILFCPGIPGAGKTVFTSIVVDHLHSRFQEDSKTGIAYFFFDYKQQDEQTTDALLARLLRQLAACQSSLPEAVHELYRQHDTRPSTEELIRVLKSVTAMYSRIFIMIDALDECKSSNGTRLSVLSCIFKLRSEIRANFFITSRFNTEISSAFSGIPTLEIRASDEDARGYLSDNMVHLPKFVRDDPSLQEAIIDSILQAVQGMFLVAQFHLDSLKGKTKPKEIITALQNLATGSDAYQQIYTKTMERIIGQYKEQTQLAKSVLSWLTFAKAPMRVPELRHALGVEHRETAFDERNMPDIELMVSVCAGLVTIDNDSNIIRLVHYTTQEYFQRTRENWFPESQSEITMSCVTYLSYEVFELGANDDPKVILRRMNPCRNCPQPFNMDRYYSTLGDALMELYPFYRYASRYWGYHAREDPVLSDAAMELLKNAAWIKAYCEISQVLLVGGLLKQTTGLHLAAWFGLTAAVDELLNSKTDIEAANRYGETALHTAASCGRKDIVQLLLDNNATIEAADENGSTPLHLALQVRHKDMEIVTRLLSQGAKVDAMDNNGRTPLFMAVHDGEVFDKHMRYKDAEPFVQLLLNNGADIKAADARGDTPLHWAVKGCDKEAVAGLLSKGADINATNGDGQTPLIKALVNGYPPSAAPVIQLLLDSGADVEAADHGGFTPLHWAVRRHLKEPELIAELLNKGAKVNATDNNGKTPLFIAVGNDFSQSWDSTDIVQLLLNNGAEINATDKDGNTPLHQAVGSHDSDRAKFLLSKGAKVDAANNNGKTPLFHLITSIKSVNQSSYSRFMEPFVQLLLDHGADVQATDDSGRTVLDIASETPVMSNFNNYTGWPNPPNYGAQEANEAALLSAAALGDKDAVQFLLERGVSVEAENESGETAIFVASRKDIIQLLLNYGADIDAVNDDGNTPLHNAVVDCDTARVRLLLKKGANTEALDKHFDTALQVAAMQGQPEIVKVLLKYNANVEAAVRGGETPLHLAAMYNTTICTKLLLRHKADLKDTDHRGNTPLHCAADYGAWQDVKLLLKWHATINATNTNGQTPLHKAVSSDSCAYKNLRSEKHEETVKVLVNSGANIEAADKDGKTPLHLAMESRHKDAAKFLLKREANVNATDLGGKTPLFYAIEGLRFGETSEFLEQLVQLLLNYGANVQVTDNLGRTVEGVAIEKNCDSVITLLIRARESNIVGSRSPPSLGEDEEMDGVEDEEDDEEEDEEDDEEDEEDDEEDEEDDEEEDGEETTA
ncbi:ankyrin repeat-containing domain protein [Trichoderma compactum]